MRKGNTAWTEWHWHGTQPDGIRVELRGVIILEIEDEVITAGRLYVEPVEEAGADIDAAVSEMVEGGDTQIRGPNRHQPGEKL